MPRIPLSEGRQLLPQRHDAVHAPNVIGGDFGMDTSRALIGAGDRIRGAGEKIAGAGLAFASALVDKENHLAAAEDRNLLNRYMQELNVKLADNPNASDEQKQAWIAERAKQYDEERKPYLDKMSTNFRKQHDAEIQGVRIRYEGERMRIMAAGRAQRVYDGYKNQIKDAGDRSDLTNYSRLIREAQGGATPVFSKEEEAMLWRDYQHLADFGAARRAVEANAVGIDDKLVERDKDGNYVHYKNLTVAERTQLARAAKVNRHNAETEEDDRHLADLYSGTITPDLEALKDDYNAGRISARQYNRRRAWEESFVKAQEAAEARSEKARHAAAGRWSQEEQKRRGDKIKALQLQFETEEFSSDAGENVKQQQRFLAAIEKDFKDDVDAQIKLRKALKTAANNGLTGKAEFSTPEGKIVLDFIRDQYRKSDGTYRNLVYDKHWYGDGDNSQDFMAARYYEIMDYAKRRIAAGDNANTVISDIKQKVEQLKLGLIDMILDRRTGLPRKAADRKTAERKSPDGDLAYAYAPDGSVIEVRRKTAKAPRLGVSDALKGENNHAE